jgi:integrase
LEKQPEFVDLWRIRQSGKIDYCIIKGNTNGALFILTIKQAKINNASYYHLLRLLVFPIMNLNDLTLLRGWIRHMGWVDLDGQLQDEAESARKRIKILRRNLVIKSRFYGKSAWVKLWQSERLHTQAWEQRALNTLTKINGLPEPIPALTDGVDQWFPESLCAALPFRVKSLADVVDLLESFYSGDATLPEPLKPSLKTLTTFFDDNALALGYQLSKKPQTTALPVPLETVTPLEKVLIPVELNGSQGSNRSTETCRITAVHDLDAIKSWLSLKDDNRKTYLAYKKELERLLLWAILERRKAISSLNTDDCRAYFQFLKTLTTSNRQWVTLQPANKCHGKWKPFYFRTKRAEQWQSSESQNLPQPVLSPRSINYAKTVISSCMEWLVKQNYLKHNNFDGIQTIKFAQTMLQTNNRAFTLSQMQKVFAYSEAQIELNTPSFWDNRRTLFILKFAFSTGLRIHELAAANFGDIECLEDESGEHYFLKVVGKHNKIRKTSLPLMFIEELRDYLKLRGLPSYFDFLPHQAPLIPSLRDKSGRKHLSPAGIHKILSTFFGQMLNHLETNDQTDKRLANKLRNASTHWLRHSYGSYLANDRQVPLTYIRDELGHSSLSTTSLYLNTDAKQRQKIVSDAFSGM